MEQYGKMEALAVVKERTGYGWRIAERVIQELADAGKVTLQPSFDRSYAWLISKDDLEKVIAHLGIAPKR
jgi:hypothetical protein